jgi:regulator of protease activity HflC (stomatin/prohibitin superfamily)
MVIIVLFSALAIAALGASFLVSLPAAGRLALMVLAASLACFGFVVGSSVVIDENEVGIVHRQFFGPPLPTGQVIARNGEMGPQAEVLGPGWHFGYFPFVYTVRIDRVMSVPQGQVGFVTARDGQPLPEDEMFAPAWPSAQDMLNPKTFLERNGRRGPQTTVLTPGTYRYNTALHEVQAIPAIQVEAGTVVVIKSNTGQAFVPAAGQAVESVNGVPLVPKGFRGVWAEPLLPGGYYLNTRAFVPAVVKTTQRTYTYQAPTNSANRTVAPRPPQPAAPARAGQPAPAAGIRPATSGGNGNDDWSVSVRSKDGFSFPVDVRVNCAIEAKNAPYVVALLGNPDAIVQDEQEGEQLEVLEARIILPAVRAIFRNVAETMNAMEFVNRRSEIEALATQRVKAELLRFRVTCDGVYVGNIRLDATEAGQKLLSTQTDREVAVNQEKLYEQQKQAEVSRANFVRAQEEAEQQRMLAAAESKVRIEGENAKAAVVRARGEAEAQVITGDGRAQAYKVLVESLGRESVAQLELLKLVVDGKIQITPQVMVTGSGQNASAMDALSGTILRQMVPPPPAPAAAPATANPR